MGGVLAAINQKISDRDTEIERLESELAAHRSPTQLETSATVGTDLSEIELADLLNELKGELKNSKTTLRDVTVLREILIRKVNLRPTA